MSLTTQTKRFVGDCIFGYQNCRGRFRLLAGVQTRLAVLVYHGLETDARRLAASSHRVTPEGCLKEIRFFRRQGYKLISAAEIESPGFGRNGDGPGYLLVSFDDGHANTFVHLKRWMEIEKIPILLGICPGIVEEDGVYWWEEVRARFQCMRQPSVEIRNSDGTVLNFSRDESEQFENTGRAVSHSELQCHLEQLRQHTRYIDPQQIRDSVYVHKNMNWQQIIELSGNSLCSLASHSLHHEIATQISTEELRHRTRTSLDMLQARTGHAVRHYVYPNGRFTEDTDRVMAELGIVHTYTTDCVLNATPLAVRLNRLNGYDLKNRSLRHYGELWKIRHALPNGTVEADAMKGATVNARGTA